LTPDATETAPPPKPVAAPPASPAQKPAVAKGKPVPMFESLPDVEFGGAALKAPVAGGQARATYLTVVYGMIMPHFTKLAGKLKGYHAKQGTVTFGVDGRGRLTMRIISEESGSRELDAAAFDAIGEAGPFPPPPTLGGYIAFHYRQLD
jgi:protein TonB